MTMRDGYSGFSFYNALAPTVISAAATGRTIDLQGYGTATIVVEVGSCFSAGNDAVTNAYYLYLQHGTASAAGVDSWSLVPASMMLHSVVGRNGALSVASDGFFQSITSAAGVTSAAASTFTFAVGYKGNASYRYLRVGVSVLSLPSSCYIAAVAILGEPGQWPVNTPATVATTP